jgi:hypothetical protein
MDKAQIEAKLKKLAEIADDAGLPDEAQKPLERLADLQLGTFVMIAGEGNFGKSSLINAIANQCIAETSVLPKTTRVDIYTPSADGQFKAMLRRRGETGWKELDWTEAHALCAADEQRVSGGGSPQLADAVWFVPNTAIPEGVCLVDTPGISQDLLGKLEPKQLVTGIDATYSIEDVWAYWIHRADFVLWVFEANRIESQATAEALEKFIAIYKKPILPVSTKIDRVRPDLRDEVPKRFQRIFGPILRETVCEEIACVCTDPKHELYGEGIPALRRRVQAISSTALQLKLKANEDFVTQQAALLEKQLTAVADMVVENLVTIAILGDQCVSILDSCLNLLLNRSHQRIHEHFAHKLIEIESLLRGYYDRWKNIAYTHGKDAAKEAARRDMEQFVDIAALCRTINYDVAEIAAEFVHRCQAESANRSVRSLEISMSCKITDRPQQIQLRVPEVNVDLSPEQFELDLKIPSAGCAVLLFAAVNALLAFAYWLYQVHV